MKDTGTEDPGWIVIDEVCGVFMALAFIPCSLIDEYPVYLAIAFGLFRFFDILKPLGIHKIEKLPGAWGVMADDLLGGLYAAIVLWLGTMIAFLFSF
jgi:phosphatidylglycerophosphatase A